MKLSGPGRVKIKLAEMLKQQLGVECDPENFWVQNPRYAKWDLARWGIDGRVGENNYSINVHSWDRMSDIVKSGKVVWVGDDRDDGEVCRGLMT